MFHHSELQMTSKWVILHTVRLAGILHILWVFLDILAGAYKSCTPKQLEDSKVPIFNSMEEHEWLSGLKPMFSSSISPTSWQLLSAITGSILWLPPLSSSVHFQTLHPFLVPSSSFIHWFYYGFLLHRIIKSFLFMAL